MIIGKIIVILLNILIILNVKHILTLSLNHSNALNYEVFLQKANEWIRPVDKVLDFINRYYFQINLDGVLGIILAKAQLHQALKNTVDQDIKLKLQILIKKCEVSKHIIKLIGKHSYKHNVFMRLLLNTHFWIEENTFVDGDLKNNGIYDFWTNEDVLHGRSAEYGGVTSDECLFEILENAPTDHSIHLCPISTKCKKFMFGIRTDTGYVLTHRLLYLSIMKRINCGTNKEIRNRVIKGYCSLILREAKTNEILGFPQHDIFIEQIVLCGMEGFSEYLKEDWLKSIVSWQTKEGCFRENGTHLKHADHSRTIRTSNVISFGCSDHTTGLAAAALSLNLRYIFSKFPIK